MEITECYIDDEGNRVITTLYKFHVTDNKVIEGKLKILGYYEKVNNISNTMQKRLLENGMPSHVLERFLLNSGMIEKVVNQ